MESNTNFLVINQSIKSWTNVSPSEDGIPSQHTDKNEVSRLAQPNGLFHRPGPHLKPHDTQAAILPFWLSTFTTHFLLNMDPNWLQFCSFQILCAHLCLQLSSGLATCYTPTFPKSPVQTAPLCDDSCYSFLFWIALVLDVTLFLMTY